MTARGASVAENSTIRLTIISTLTMSLGNSLIKEGPLDLTDFHVIKSDFPVFVFENVIDTNLFKSLKREFPLTHSRVSNHAQYFLEAHSSDPENPLKTRISDSPEWNRFVTELLDGNFKRQLIRFLLKSRKAWNSQLDYWKIILRLCRTKTRVTVSLHSGIRGYRLTPHTDKADKFAALILYFGSDQESGIQNGGTTFYRPKSIKSGRSYLRKLSGFDKGHWALWPFKLLPLSSAQLPRTYSSNDNTGPNSLAMNAEFLDLHEAFFSSHFSANTLVLFFKDQLTWHQVDLSGFPEFEERQSLLINIYCSPTHLKRVAHKVTALFQGD